MSLLTEFEASLEEDYQEMTSKIAGFFSDEVKNSPVDTGEYRSAWEMDSTKKWTWVLKNSMDYAPILWGGRRQINGVWYGSEQGFYAEPIEVRLARLEEIL
jgi:hypothetical protein